MNRKIEIIIRQAELLKKNNKIIEAIDFLKKGLLSYQNNPELHSLLSNLFIINNEIENAEKSLSKAIILDNNLKSIGLNKVRLNIKKKEFSEALKGAKFYNEKFPKDIEGIVVLSNCLRLNNKINESIKLSEIVIKKDPQYADAYVILGLIKLSKKNRDESLSYLRKAFKINPYIKAIWPILLSLTSETNNKNKIIKLLDDFIKYEKDNGLYHYEKAYFYQKNQMYNDALECYKNAIKSNFYNPQIYSNIADIYEIIDDTNGANKSYLKGIAVDPDNSEIYNNYAVFLKNQGELEKASENFFIAAQKDPNNNQILRNLAYSLKDIRFINFSNKFSEMFIMILDKGTIIRPQSILPAIISLIKTNPEIKKFLNLIKDEISHKELNKIFEFLQSYPLFLKVISLCPIIDIEIEQLIKKLRNKILINIDKSWNNNEIKDIQEALVSQCIINDHVYGIEESEKKLLSKIDYSLKKQISEKNSLDYKKLLCLSSYYSLEKKIWFNYLKFFSPESFFFKNHIMFIMEEDKIKNQIKSIKKIKNKISLDVKDQYEENPYPKWISPSFVTNPISINELAKNRKLRFENNSKISNDKLNVLIAGCGTGQQPIESAKYYKNSKVTSIDISSKSLSYAIFKANQFKVDNIEFLQADILDLNELKIKFDIIECVGVLHHMEDPLLGLQKLIDTLKPKGLLKIGLYSKIARENINNLKNKIKYLELKNSKSDMINFRDQCIKSKNDIISSYDFYTTSSLRDLLFHVQEHQFNLTEIEKIIKDFGLNFCGFDIDSYIVDNFIKSNSNSDSIYNLNLWNNYEIKNKDTFKGMYQFWVQKL